MRIVKPSVKQAAAPLHTAQTPVRQVSGVEIKQDFEHRQSKMIQEISSAEDKEQEMKNSEIQDQEKRETISDPILVDFVDVETRSQVHRSAFIEPSELDALQSARNDKESEHEHQHDESQHNITQNDDPHGSQQFCVDISEYLDLKWVVKDSEECHVTFAR